MAIKQYIDEVQKHLHGQIYALSLYPGSQAVEPGFVPLASRCFRGTNGEPTPETVVIPHGGFVLIGDHEGQPNLQATAWLRGAGTKDIGARDWQVIASSRNDVISSIGDGDIDKILDQIDAGLSEADMDLVLARAI
ncbi:MAG: hypothetical protein AAGA55_07680 [Planctomycetota bacterium]